jgi:hypothetical protein
LNHCDAQLSSPHGEKGVDRQIHREKRSARCSPSFRRSSFRIARHPRCLLRRQSRTTRQSCPEPAEWAADACVDLTGGVYIDPAQVSEVELPFNSNRTVEQLGEVFGGETKKKRSFEDRHPSTQAYPGAPGRPRCVQLAPFSRTNLARGCLPGGGRPLPFLARSRASQCHSACAVCQAAGPNSLTATKHQRKLHSPRDAALQR